MKTALLIALALGSNTALAQDEASSRNARKGKDEVVREVVRGVYMKAGAGSNQFILNYSGLIRPVAATNLAVGQDFIDREKMSVAWEVDLQQSLHNGPKFEELSALPSVVQGDIHMFGILGFVEASAYLTRRFGIGLRAGGGVSLVPTLVEPTAYETEIVGAAWGGVPSPVHAGPLPTFGGGPTIEYYTKLSHFSVGADIDVLYVVNLDLALAPGGYLKYTF